MPYIFPLLVVGIFALYYWVNPLCEKFPLQCPWYILTNTQCPSCGMQRALHALMHGEFSHALSYNYFFVLSIPYALMAVVSTWYNFNHVFDGLKFYVFHRYTLTCYIILYFVWWIIRNIYNIWHLQLQFITNLHDICHFYKEIIAENVKFITNYLFLSGKNINFALAILVMGVRCWVLVYSTLKSLIAKH